MASDGDEDDDLRRAIALSLQDVQGSTAERPIILEDNVERSSEPAQSLTSTNGTGFLGLDRKQMEQERLSRKRKASPQVQEASRIALGPNPSSRKHNKSGYNPTFLKGVVKKTWVLDDFNGSDSIRLEEILEKNDLQLAVLSSFQWDIPWLFAKMNVSETRITLIMQAKDQAMKEQYRQETAYLRNLKIRFPSMEGQINCMHSKLMLLSHPNYLRIVVPTANLVSYDWGETGSMENMCFIIDLPRLPEGEQVEKLTMFGEELVYFLNAQGLEKSIVKSLYRFDFSKTKNIAFIHTIGGAHTGSDAPWRRTGFCGLGLAVQKLGLATKQHINIDFVASSVGALNLDFLSSIYLACQGDDGSTTFEAKYGGKSKEAEAAKGKRTEIQNQIQQRYRVFYPTHDTVRKSKAGSAGTIHFQSKWYNSPKFPKSIMRDCQSKRKGMLMHNKIIYVTNNPRPWAYIGSANCSESAWGALYKDKSSNQPKLNCRNWECGVLLSTAQQSRNEEADNMDGSEFSASLEAAFEGVIPIPMRYPGEEYGSQKPWYYSEALMQ